MPGKVFLLFMLLGMLYLGTDAQVYGEYAHVAHCLHGNNLTHLLHKSSGNFCAGRCYSYGGCQGPSHAILDCDLCCEYKGPVGSCTPPDSITCVEWSVPLWCSRLCWYSLNSLLFLVPPMFVVVLSADIGIGKRPATDWR